MTKLILKISLPLLILGSAFFGAHWFIDAKAKQQPEAKPRELPTVKVQRVQAVETKFNVLSQGVIRPFTEIPLIAEAAGKLVKLHPAFTRGGFFKQGEVLLAVDARDYQFAITRAEAQVSEARKELLREQEEVQQVKKEWQTLGEGEASDFVLHKPHLAERRAKLAAAEAELAQAKLNLSRAEIRAPFTGRVRDKSINLGQYVNFAETLAHLYATDVFEVSLPIPAEQLRFISLPQVYPDKPGVQGSKVTLSADLAGKRHQWPAQIVRAENVIDSETGVQQAVAQIRHPYQVPSGSLPLSIGQFVQAEIEGVAQRDLIKLPLAALHAGFQVFIVNEAKQLESRSVEVLRNDSDGVVVNAQGLDGQQVMISGIDLPVAGMQVKVQDVNAKSGT